MTEIDRVQEETRLIREENRRLRVELLRAQEDRDQARERLAYALRQVAELGRRVPTTQVQAAAPGAVAARARRTRSSGSLRRCGPPDGGARPRSTNLS